MLLCIMQLWEWYYPQIKEDEEAKFCKEPAAYKKKRVLLIDAFIVPKKNDIFHVGNLQNMSKLLHV